MTFSSHDKKWMKRALTLAKKGQGNVSPNPMVGCVIVKNNRIISEGWHEKFGSPHAEIIALQKVKNVKSLSGATLYANLEPCVHFGKTPPCVPEIIKARLRRVVIGMQDQNPLVFGKGIRALKKAKIKVDIGCLESESKALNEVFIKNMKTGLPFVALKVAMSLDGKIATRTGESKWITSEKSRILVKKLRAKYDAILVGKNTVLQDNPELTAFQKESVRIILDSSFESSLSAKVFQNNRAILVTTKKAKKAKIVALQKKGIVVKIFPEKISLSPLLHWLLKEKNISSIFVEGGSEIFGAFFDEKLVDKVYFFIAPKIIGGKNAKSAIAGEGVKRLTNSLRISEWKFFQIGPDLFIEGEVS